MEGLLQKKLQEILVEDFYQARCPSNIIIALK